MGVMLRAFYWDCPKSEGREHQSDGIDALTKVHEQNAAGPTQVLFVGDDLYVMQRLGAADKNGLVLVLNNRGTWNGTCPHTME
jgi:hypothetical protein